MVRVTSVVPSLPEEQGERQTQRRRLSSGLVGLQTVCVCDSELIYTYWAPESIR